MMTTLTITSKRQLTLTKELMGLLGVEIGGKILAKVEDKKVVLEPVGGGILSLVGKMPKIKIPKGKTVDDVINDARDEYISQKFRGY